MQKFVSVFDIDGTISDDNWRRHLLPREKYQKEPRDGGAEHRLWDDYHSLMEKDLCMFQGAEALRAAISAGHYIYLATARPAKYQDKTFAWLHANFTRPDGTKLKDGVDFSLLMRPYEDKATSPDLKARMLSGIETSALANGWARGAFYDDRRDVCEMAQARGWLTYQVCQAGFYPHPFNVEEVPLVAAQDSIGYTEPRQFIALAPAAVSAVASVGAAEIADVAARFEAMADTLRSRSANYGYNAGLVARLLGEMFPNGITLATVEDFEMWHLFELKVVKLSRFVNSGLKHQDSVHDDAIYSGFVERLVDKHDIKIHDKPATH